MIFHQPQNSQADYEHNAFFYTDEVWDAHFHKNPELIYVVSGAVDCTVNNTAYHLTAGDFGLCLSYDVHAYSPAPNTVYWVLVFSEDHIRFLAKQLAGKTGNGFPFRCKEAVERFVRDQLIYGEPTTLTLKSALYAVLEEYLRHVPLIERSTKEARMASVISDYVLEHHTQKLTLDDLARQLGYDYNYMSRCFRNTFNMTFSEFVNVYRLETAITLLEETNETVVDIAFKSGFQSVRAFNDFFKKATALSPTQYRKASRH